MKKVAALMMFLCLAGPAHSELITQSEAVLSTALANKFDKIAGQSRLSVADTMNAKRTAWTWYLLGPCEGSMDGLPQQFSQGALTLSVDPDPSIPFVATVLQMVGLLTTQNLGRGAPKWLCDYAYATVHNWDEDRQKELNNLINVLRGTQSKN